MSGHYRGNYGSYGYTYREHERAPYSSRGSSSLRGRRGGYGSSYSKGSSYTPGQLPRNGSVYRPGQNEGSTYIPDNQQTKELSTEVDIKEPETSTSIQHHGPEIIPNTVVETTDLTSESKLITDQEPFKSISEAKSDTYKDKEWNSHSYSYTRPTNDNHNSQGYQSYKRSYSYRGGYRTDGGGYHPFKSGYKSNYNHFNSSNDSYGGSPHRNFYDNHTKTGNWRLKDHEGYNRFEARNQEFNFDNNARSQETHKSRDKDEQCANEVEGRPESVSRPAETFTEYSSFNVPSDRNNNSHFNSPDVITSSTGSGRFVSTVKSVNPSPLVDIVSLNSFRHVKGLTASGSTTPAELSILKESLNNFHEKSCDFQQFKLDWEKEHISSDFQIERLKAQVKRDEMTVKFTEEKLDSITLI